MHFKQQNLAGIGAGGLHSVVFLLCIGSAYLSVTLKGLLSLTIKLCKALNQS